MVAVEHHDVRPVGTVDIGRAKGLRPFGEGRGGVVRNVSRHVGEG